MSKIDESYVVKQYGENFSTYSIAKELDTYPKKIERILKKNGIKLRSRSEAQALAIKSGRAKHPTEGTERSDEQKLKISEGKANHWKNMSKEDREAVSQASKERWDNIPPEKKRQMLESAGRALRMTTIEGSKAEKSLKKNLETDGFEVVLHKKNLIQGKYEIDLFLPEIKTIIEIDGPQHFKPIFGEMKLQKTIKQDAIKNGLLVAAGYCVIRVKYMCKHLSQSVERKLWALVSEEVGKIKDKFPPKGKRFIELEIDNE
jgi:very-short-patch-repair endonuclease|tara:strand:+ start:446 stop:1225 length:780 start_codon:yes stop_codon:yes gene_type:complete